MKEVLVIMIWDKAEDVYTRPIIIDSKTKELKMNGKKPNKCIIPESCIDIKLLRKIKSICSYNAEIIKAKGK